MGKIKVLFAAENGDDDLYTEEEIKEFLDAKKAREKEMEDMWEKLQGHIDDCMEEIVAHVSIILIDKVWKGDAKDMQGAYSKACYEVSRDLVDTLCETYMLDLKDKEYADLIGKTNNLLHLKLGDRVEIAKVK